MKALFRRLVRLYHPDRFAHDPEKQASYARLTQAINQARDRRDIAALREIAADPNAFLERQGYRGPFRIQKACVFERLRDSNEH